jgi:hypothetical protein
MVVAEVENGGIPRSISKGANGKSNYRTPDNIASMMLLFVSSVSDERSKDAELLT